MLLLVLRGLHVEDWTKDTSTSDGVVDLTFFVAILIFALLLLEVVLLVFVVLLLVLLLLVELSLLLSILLLLVCMVTVEVLSRSVLSLIMSRFLLFFLGLLLLLSLLLYLRCFLQATSETVDLAGEPFLLGLVDLELKELFVLLGHPKMPASHLVRLQLRQVVVEAVGVVEDLDVLRVEPGLWLDVPVVLGEDLVL